MGGVAGHLMHLYDNRDLSYNDIADILSKASQGELVGTEKTDGFNIYLGFKDGEARAARNKGDMRRGGMNAAAVAARNYKGGPQVRQIYIDSFRAFEKAMLSLSEEERAKLFGPDGEIFYNTEILGMLQPEEPEGEPRPANVIKYDPSMITIHPAGHKRYNPETNSLEVVDVSQNAKVLDAAVDRFTEALAGEDFQLARTAVAQLNKLDNDHDLNIALSRIQKSGLTGDMTINDLLTDRVSQVVNERFSVLSEEKRQGIVARVLKLEGHPSLVAIKKGLPKDIANEVSKFIKEDSIIPIRKVIAPIEDAIHDLAVELLSGLQSAYILDNKAEVERLRKEVETAIANIKQYTGEGSEKAHEMLYRQLLKLKHHDKIDTAVEGFVFQHNGNLYKFTGNFAPVNHLLGLFKYGRGSVPPIREPGEDEINEQAGMVPSRVLAVVPGAFKPPHRGHVAMVAEYAGEADEVIVLVSPVERGGITADQSLALWNLYLEELPYDNIKVMKSPVNSPVLAAYQFVENPDDNPLWAQPGDEVIMGVSTKGGDEERFCKNVQKYAREGVLIRSNCAIDPAGGSYVDSETGEALSATNMRRAIEQGGRSLLPFIPPEAHDRIDDIEDILMRRSGKLTMENIFKMIEEVIEEKKKEPAKTAEKKKAPITLENLFDMVEEVIDEEEEKVEEISSMAGGSVAGYSLPLGAKPRKTNKKKRKGRRIYIPD
jgi:hypothetical protein